MTDLQPLIDMFGLTTSEFRDNRRVVVAADKLVALLETLKNAHGFRMLVDITCVDYLEYEGASDRFGVVYCLLNMTTGERLIVRTFINDPTPSLPTVTGRAPTGWSARCTTCSASPSPATPTSAASSCRTNSQPSRSARITPSRGGESGTTSRSLRGRRVNHRQTAHRSTRSRLPLSFDQP
jgi:Ni,Fe-hydrogenase III component G